MKNLFPAVLMLLSTCAFADEMQFITVLSTPVGSFNRLEAVDSSAPAQGATVNFCTKIGTGGRVQLKGNNNVGIENANLSTNTTLGRSSAGDYVLQKITLNSAGSVTGSRLLSNVVKVSGQGVGKSSNLYGTTLTVAGAKTKNLNVGNGKSVMSGTGSTTEMVWSNEYQDDTSGCGDTATCAQQYLLKSKGGSDGRCQPGPRGEKYEAFCPIGQTGGPITFTWDYTFCRYMQSGFCKSGGSGDDDSNKDGDITCITTYNWKTLASDSYKNNPSACEYGNWHSSGYTLDMTCGGKNVNEGLELWTGNFNSSTTCTPGRYYLYRPTVCLPTHKSCSAGSLGYGYYCLYCGTVSSASNCSNSSRDIPTIEGGDCAQNSGSSGNLEPRPNTGNDVLVD